MLVTWVIPMLMNSKFCLLMTVKISYSGMIWELGPAQIVVLMPLILTEWILSTFLTIMMQKIYMDLPSTLT